MSARAYRIAPRVKTARRPASRIDWDRTGRIALVLVFFVVLALYVSPALNFLDAWQDSRAEATQLAALKEEHEQLQERAAALAEPDAAERGVRRLGMVDPAERSVVIQPSGQ